MLYIASSARLGLFRAKAPSSSAFPAARLALALAIVLACVLAPAPASLWAQDSGRLSGGLKSGELGKILVTATRGEKSVQDAPGAVTVITKEEMANLPSLSMSTLITSIPGFSFRRGDDFTLATPTMTVRGISGNRTLIMLDGIPMIDPRTGEAQMDGISPLSLERVEAVKGPMSALYGSAMAGAVNLVTAMPEDLELMAKVTYGDGGDLSHQNAMSSYFSVGHELAERLSFRVAYYRKVSDGFPNQLTTTSTRPAAGPYIATRSASGAASYIIGDKGAQEIDDMSVQAKARVKFGEDSSLALGFMRNELETTYGVPHTLDGAPVYGTRDAWNRTGHQMTYGPWGRERSVYSAALETSLGPVFTKLSLSLLDADYHSSNGTLTAANTSYSGGAGRVVEANSKTFLADLQFSSPFLSNQLLTWGLSYKYDAMDSLDNNLSNWKDRSSVTGVRDSNGGKTSLWSLYLQDEIALADSLTVYLGGRMDWWRVFDAYTQDTRGPNTSKIAYASRSASSFSPKAAVVFKPLDGTAIRLSGGGAFNAPSLYQLFVTWGSSSAVYMANPYLDPEKVWSWDASLTQRLWEGSEATVGYFENRMRNLISSASPVIGGVTRPRENIAKALSRGFEAQLRWEIGERLALAADYTYTSSKITEDRTDAPNVGRRLTFVPKHLWNASIEGSAGPVKGWLGARYISKRFGNDNNSDVLSGVYGSYDAAFTMSAKLTWEINEHVSTSLSANNIFDRHYYDGSYIAPGASWHLDLALTY